MVDFQRAIVRRSVRDVIQILENEPIKGDMVAEITAVQVMNRLSIAHLSIERALKFLITKAGGPLEKDHNLADRYRELLQYDSPSATFLEKAFQAAVHHYRYNPNAAGMSHLKTLDMYLAGAGSQQAFEEIRYWELTQSLNELQLRRSYLSLHIELLHALSELLLAPNRTTETVKNRVERTVKEAMWNLAELGYSSGTAKERSVHAYMDWRRGFNTWGDALGDAVKRGFDIGDDFMANRTREAHRTLLQAPDPAVRYFASILDVLPRQSRDAVPCVEWLGPEKERSGCVKTPAGTVLGFIERGQDALWYITPSREGLVMVSAKATTQTDARCYLARLLSSPAQVIVKGESRSLRIVGEERSLFGLNFDEIDRRFEGTSDGNIWTHQVTLWNGNHGIEANEAVRFEVKRREGWVEVLEGLVTEVTGPEVYVSGDDYIDKAR